MMPKPTSLSASALFALFLFAVPAGTKAATIITLNSLTDSVMAGLDSNNVNNPTTAPGDGWFTGTYAGTLRGRASNPTNLRTQWNFRFDAAALGAVSSADILSVTLDIPQIGRLNTVDVGANHMNLYANSYNWHEPGAPYAVFNGGRNQNGGSGSPAALDFGSYNTHGTATDTSNPNVEGTFSLDSTTYSDILTAVKSWADDPANNDGFLMTYESADNIGLAFGTPTLTVEVVPEPSSSAVLLMLASTGLLLRRRRR